MMRCLLRTLVPALGLALIVALIEPPVSPAAQASSDGLQAFKRDVIAEVDARRQLTQQIVDSLFSFSELGFQEIETERYLTGILEREGFSVRRGVAGIPTAWTATWGSGRPVIALGTDVDGVPGTNQRPGVLTRSEIVPGAPGHGEGHNSGHAVVVTAVLAAKRIMEREKLSGTLVVWPGVAEEQLATKAHLVRAGVFKGVDVVLYSHVGSALATTWGDSSGSGLVSVQYTFTGSSSHAGIAPWLGRSALDAVELMNIGWNFRREHLRLAQRSHYVITNGGDQPNVVPASASVWYYFRENDYDRVKELWDLGDTMARGAATMTGTTVESRVLGSAWPLHGNRPVAEAMQANIAAVGAPPWSDDDQQFARALQRTMGVPERGLVQIVAPVVSGVEVLPDSAKLGGSSDDVGDIMWSVPTVMLNFPSNVAGMIQHHWSSAIAMATPVAHKGATQGAKVQAMTVLDLVMRPELVKTARGYFETVQGKQRKYQPLLRPEDQPAVWLNKESMERFRPELRKHYYDASRFASYLEQLKVAYPPPMPASPPAAR